MAPGISRVLEHIMTTFQRLRLCFGLKLSGDDRYGFVGRRCVLEIQDGSRITGSTNNYAGFTDTPVIPKTIQGFMTMYV